MNLALRLELPVGKVIETTTTHLYSHEVVKRCEPAASGDELARRIARILPEAVRRSGLDCAPGVRPSMSGVAGRGPLLVVSTSSIGSGAGVLNAGFWSLWGTLDPNPTGARALWDADGATFENMTYCIRIGADQTVMVANHRMGDTYIAFAPVVGDDGACCIDACDSVALVLEDGAKLTLQTTVTAVDDDGSPLSSQRNVTITCHDFGLHVSGLGSAAGFRCVQTVAYGWLLDGAVADGHVLQENAQGAGLWGADPQDAWQVMGEESVSAEELAALAKLSPWLSECMKALVSLHCLFSITLVGNHRTLLGKGADERHKLGRDDGPRRVRAPTDDVAPWLCQLRRAANGFVFAAHPGVHPSWGRHELAAGRQAA
jgi:hypothetical protein